MSLTRRELLKAGAAAGALLVARPVGTLAEVLGPAPYTTARTSRLFPNRYHLAHADLHNHSLMSDGDGRAEDAFASMRAAGLDIAALTDHSTIGMEVPGLSSCSECSSLLGIDEKKWKEKQVITDNNYEPHRFVSIRGFEWSSPALGHINVWLSEQWTDPLHTGGATTGEGIGQFMHDESDGHVPQTLSRPLDEFMHMSPTRGLSMRPFYQWLTRDPGTPLLGGGSDGIAGFNHPGREVSRFGYFAFQPELVDRMVSCEVFNRREDYLFEGTDSGVASPINQCLNEGWKVGLLGVTDEHGKDWGYPDGKGRTGLWVKELTREGMREAMMARRFFSTRLRGLRLDAAANGVQMGGKVRHRSGSIEFELDIDRGPEWWGKELSVQVLQSGTIMPTVVASEEIEVPEDDDSVVSFDADIDIEDGDWVVLRITDPSSPADRRATGEWRSFGDAIAYASPFFLSPT